MRLFDYIHQGGVIMYILIFLNIIGIALMLFKFYSLHQSKKNIDQIADELSSKIDPKKGDSHTIVEFSKKELEAYIGQEEKGLATIKIIASISPLLGLLGTVLGVLVSFNKMSQSGLGDPSVFASGISMALITTVGGLIVSIPHYIGHSYLVGILDFLESTLEKEVLLRVLK